MTSPSQNAVKYNSSTNHLLILVDLFKNEEIFPFSLFRNGKVLFSNAITPKVPKAEDNAHISATSRCSLMCFY